MGHAAEVLYGLGAYQEAQACLDEAMQAGPALRQTGLLLARIAPLVYSAKLNGHLTEVLALSAQWRAVPEVQEARRQLQSLMPTAPPSKQ